MFWRIIARFLARPFIARLIIDFAKRTPYEHIYDDPETKKNLYMGRWWLLTERWWLPIAARVHHIARPDRDREKHDHPVKFRTIILMNEYIEEDLLDQQHWRKCGSTVAHSAEYFHKITYVAKDTYTLFIYWNWGPRNLWGFLKGDMYGVVKVPWQKYLDEKAARERAEAAEQDERIRKNAPKDPPSDGPTLFANDMSTADAVRNFRNADDPLAPYVRDDRQGYDSRARTDEQQNFTGI